jgi:ribosome recycling factor
VKSKEWSERQKQELLNQIKQLEAENGNYKEEIKRLKTQLEQLTSQHIAQIEVKENKKWHWLKLRK